MIRIRMLAAAALTAAVAAAGTAAPAQAGQRKQMIRTINYVRGWKHRHPLAFSGRLSRGAAAVNSTVMEWWNSTDHRRLMMAGDFRHAGAGRATGYFGGRKCTIWVVRFT